MRNAVVLVAVLGGALPISGQSPTPTPQPPVSVFRDSVVVSSSLREQEKADSSATVESIDREEIERRQATSISEVLGTLPGMAVVQQGGVGQLTSVFTRGAESDQILVLWNGIELNDPYFGGFNWAFLPTEGVERIEVVRGPYSALYGSDAVGGVVQVLSGGADGGSLRLEGGGDGYGRGAFAWGRSWERVRLDLTAHSQRSDGELDNAFFDSDELTARFDWTLAPGWTVGLLTRGNESESGIPLSGGSASPQRRIAWQERQAAVPIRGRWGAWSLDATLSRVDYDSSFRDPEDAFGFTRSDTESSSERARLVLSRSLGDGFWLAGGGELEQLEVNDSSTFGVNLDAASHENRSLFTQAHGIAGKLRFDLGVRWDDSEAFGSQVSPRLGAVWRFSETTRLRASYGEAFRAPSIGELFFPFSGNPRLEPETAESYELGVEHAADDWRLALTLFDTRQENLIDFDFVTFANVNLGRARSRGVEAELGLRRGGWSVDLNATLLDAEDRVTDEALLRRPDESANLVVTWSGERWTLNAVARYVGERPDVDPVTFSRTTNEAYQTLDLAGSWQASGSFSPYLRLENALDESYEPALGFPAEGRRLVAGLHIDL